MKEFWLRFKSWIKGFPWKFGAMAAVLGILFLIFLVEGKVYLWDYVYMAGFSVVLTFFIWKMAKRP